MSHILTTTQHNKGFTFTLTARRQNERENNRALLAYQAQHITELKQKNLPVQI